ncbi:hypothetical protein FOMPIDRAFT_1049471 [Fomitopsis schrenkii]|uniref:Uncharacterized protein n=1 Tax=Fomitopsis schrenkii TaxID=2126942 RepID=S8FH27_FOMSC|nr:hypothetical protein FOMPIDRAFT_1049471 [Fomitopsis schrenkii]
MLNRKAADLVDRETTTGLGQYSLRLPSYRSSYARRYHPYPAVRRRARNDEPYMDRLVDFDFEAAEHVLELPPSLQLRPIQGDHSDDDDVTMFALDEGTSKQARKKQGREVTHPEEEKAWDDNTAEAITRPPARLTLTFVLFLFVRYVRDSLAKLRANTLKEVLPK